MKKIIVCCDGTWNSVDSPSEDTNVFRIAKAIHGNDGAQIVLYLKGVGTTGLKIGDWVEGAIGLGVDENIQSAYMFVAQNYVPGDEIYLFGFSRGAYTARSLVGFISACGILKRQCLDALPRAWTYYRGPAPHDPDTFARSCDTECHTSPLIRFLGVWETVGAMGIPGKAFTSSNNELYGFHDTGPCKLVVHGCHALAINENRHNFVPTFWTGTPYPNTVIEQVWFAGAHADVGGGYKMRSLADIPLVWMAKKAEADGLELDWTCLPDPTKLDPTAPTHDSSSGMFVLDSFRRTWRRVAQTDCTVGTLENLYVPVDQTGQQLATINEAIHESVVKRYAAPGASVCQDDNKNEAISAQYRPTNLQRLFDAAGTYVGAVPIVQ